MHDQKTEALPCFDAPQEFLRGPDRPVYACVDPRGYPLLYHTVPTTQLGLRQLRGRLQTEGKDLSDDFLHKFRIITNTARLLQGTADGAERRRIMARQYRTTYEIEEKLSDDGIYDLLRECVKDARQLVKDYQERFVPENLLAPFTSDGRTEGVDDPVDMLLDIATTPFLDLDPHQPADHITRIRLYAMRRDLLLGEQLFENFLRVQEITAGKPFERTLTQYLEERFFIPGLQRQCTARIAVDELGHPVRVLGETDAAPEPRSVVPFQFIARYFRAPGPEGKRPPLPVFFDPGQKDSDAVLIKMIERGITDARDLSDLFRFQLVFRDESEKRLGIQVIAQEVFNTLGSTRHVEERRPGAKGGRHPNICSARGYRATHADYEWGGYCFEGQFHALKDWIKDRTAKDDVRRDFYKARQALIVLPRIAPREIFGVDWEDPVIHEEILAR